MKHINCILLTFFLTIPSTIKAESTKAVLTFFVGNITVLKEGKTAVKAKPGAALSVNDIIKTGKNSQAEIRINDNFYYIGENKYIQISSLSAENTSSPILNVIKKVRDSSVKSPVITIAAIRADKNEDDLLWADENSALKSEKTYQSRNDDYVLKKMAEMVLDNRFIAAWDYYHKMKVSPKNKNIFDFMAGITGYNLCNYSEAAEIFSSLAKISSDSRIKNESAFYAGISLNSGLNYSESINYLTIYLSGNPDGNHSAQAYFLRGVSYLNTGEKEKARKDLNHIINFYPADPVAGNADSILKEIK